MFGNYYCLQRFCYVWGAVANVKIVKVIINLGNVENVLSIIKFKVINVCYLSGQIWELFVDQEIY